MGCDKKLSLLSYNRLCELVEQKVIEGVPLENVNGASIDITLGNRFIFEKAVVDFTRNAQVVLKYRESFEPLEIEIVDEDSVILKPGEFVLAQSREIFNLPRNIAAEYKLKSSLARIGLDHFNAGWCFSGDTKISLLNGTEQPIKDLVGKQFWVYSIDEKAGIVPGFVSAVFETGKVTRLLKVTLDNKQSFECTPDHLIMLRDGSYKKAKELIIGQSLMPLYRKINQNKEYVLDTRFMFRKRWKPTHRLVYEYLNGTPSKHSCVHHIDHISSNNSPENLSCMNRWEHIKHHNEIRNKSENQRLIASKTMAKTIKKLWEDPDYRERQKIKNKELARRLNEKQWNHSVVSIEELIYTDPIPVYDMTVESHHNFALSCGVFVHNCDPGWNNSVLTLELKNCLQYHTIVLTPGDKIGQMIFFECDEVPEQSSYAQRGRYNSDKGVTKIKL